MLHFYLKKVCLLVEKNMEPDCVEYIKPLSKRWAKLGEFWRTNLQFLQLNQIKAPTAQAHIHACACTFVGSCALSQTTKVQNLLLMRTIVYFYICFKVEILAKAFCVSVNNRLKAFGWVKLRSSQLKNDSQKSSKNRHNSTLTLLLYTPVTCEYTYRHPATEICSDWHFTYERTTTMAFK